MRWCKIVNYPLDFSIYLALVNRACSLKKPRLYLSLRYDGCLKTGFLTSSKWGLSQLITENITVIELYINVVLRGFLLIYLYFGKLISASVYYFVNKSDVSGLHQKKNVCWMPALEKRMKLNLFTIPTFSLKIQQHKTTALHKFVIEVRPKYLPLLKVPY